MLFRSCSLFILPFFIAAAVDAGPVTGRVVDPDGRAVPGAQVLVLVLGGSITVPSATTGGRGEFTIAAPDSGRLELRIVLDGFRAGSLQLDASSQSTDVGTMTLQVSALTESVVVSAAQVEIPLSKASASVTVVTGAELEDRQIQTVADALRSVPGLAVVASGGRGAVTSVFPRGGESNYTLVFVDGIQANTFGGDYDFGHLSTANIDRIEIVRGPQSALYGSNAIGAVVRVVTRRGGPIAGSGSIEGGGYGTMRAAAAASGARGAWEWGGSAEHLASDGMNGRRTAAGETVANDDYTRSAAAFSGGWRAAGGRSVRGDLRYARDERGAPGPFGTNPIGAFTGIDTISRGSDGRWLASIAGTLPTGTRVRTHAHVSYGRIDGDFESPFGPSSSGSRRLTARAQSDVTLPRHFDLSAGIELQRERAGSSFITDAAAREIPVERSVAGYFAEGRWSHAERLFVTGGVRLDDIRRRALASDGFRPAFSADSIVSTNPKIAAAWFVRPAAGSFTKLRASAGTGIRPPDGFEVAFTDNPGLKPERSRSVEAGVDQAFAGGRAVVEATAFANTYDDLIVAVGSFREASRFLTDNISNARAHGVELAGTARGRARRVDLQVHVAYTLLATRILAVDRSGEAPPPFTVGDPLLRRPRHQVAGDVTATAGRFSAFFHGGARGRVLDVEPTNGTFGGLFHAPGYSVWNAGASWRVMRRVDLFGRVENLFDRSYEEALGFPALGRAGMVGLRIAAGR